MHQLDFLERHAGGLENFDRGIESSRVPGDRDLLVSQLHHVADRGVAPHHEGAGADGGVEADDLAFTQRLNALDRAPFAYRIDFQCALLQLRFLPALRKIFDPAGDALWIVLMILDRQALVAEEALLHRDPPRPVVRIAVTLQPNSFDHRGLLVIYEVYGQNISRAISASFVEFGRQFQRVALR